MATIGSLIVNVSANLAPLQKGLAKGSKGVQSFASSITGAQKLLVGFGSAMAASFAVQKITQFGQHLHDTAQTMEETALAAQRMGVAVDEYIKLGHAAKMANVEQETLTKSLDIYLKNLGGGKLDKPLKNLGLSPSELQTTDTVTAIGMIADKIRELPTPAAKAAAATQIFGRAGQQLLPLFEEGSAGIREAAAEAERLGIVFDEVAAERIMAANDALDRMSQAGKGLSQTLAITLAPTVETLVTDFTEVITGMSNAGDGMDSMATEGLKLADSIDAVVDSIKIYAKFLMAVVPNLSLGRAANIPSALAEANAYTQGVIAEETPSQRDYRRRVENARRSQGGGSDESSARPASKFNDNRAGDFFSHIDKIRGDLATPQEKFNSTILDLDKLLGVGAISWQEWARGIAEARKELDKATGATEKLEKQQEAAKKIIEETRTPLQTYQEKIKEAKDLLAAGLINQTQFNAQDKLLQKEMKDALNKDAPNIQGAGAFEKGTVAAFSASAQADAAKLTANLQKQQLAVEQQQLKAQQALVAEAKRQTAAAENVVVMDFGE